MICMATATPVDIGSLIVSTPGIVGGSARIAGTRLSVKIIAELYNSGLTAEAIVVDYRASLNQVYAAIAYYLSNKQAIDDEIAADDEYIRRQMAEHPETLHCAQDA